MSRKKRPQPTRHAEKKRPQPTRHAEKKIPQSTVHTEQYIIVLDKILRTQFWTMTVVLVFVLALILILFRSEHLGPLLAFLSEVVPRIR